MQPNRNVPDDPQPPDDAHDRPAPPLFRCRVTALLEGGATVDGGIYTASSVQQLINQAKQRLSAQQLLQVVRWRLEIARSA
jgi:hypothetical protein